MQPHLKKQWCIGKLNGAYLERMETVLDTYERPHDPNHPVVSMDERPCCLIGERVAGLQMQPGKVQKEHYAYTKHGQVNLLAAIEPLTGVRMAELYEQRTMKEFTHFMQKVADHYPDAQTITVVLDNLSTHSKGAFYEHLPADQAQALAKRFNFVHTPKSASWLNIIEIEFSSLSRRCLNRRIASKETLRHEVMSFLAQRQRDGVKIEWQFTTQQARKTLHRHYTKVFGQNAKFNELN